MPILVFLDWTKEFHVHVDASSIALGVVLAQPGEEEIDHPISFSSRNISTTKNNYTLIERERLLIVYYMKKYHHYSLGSNFKFYIDHFFFKIPCQQNSVWGEGLLLSISLSRV